uniref:BPTI/Kunitz inhibitor domain-containing protein n=1 Tax=Haemonchus contortus TaxID=6289 RepID=A0A7I5EDH0_HAECO
MVRRTWLDVLLAAVVLLPAVNADLPTELDPFLEVLFDVKECDSFLSGDYTSVATKDCAPYKCDFPLQVCMRPNAQYQEASANECRPVPTDCLTAANGGKPVASSLLPIPTPTPTISRTGDKSRKEMGGFGGFGVGKTVNPMPINPTDICEMGPPNGRFCGFRVMYTYNKETLQCDEFWFPGCTTEETNANLFSDLRSCQKLADMCKVRSTPSPPLVLTPDPPTSTTMWTPRPPPTPPPTASPLLPGLMGRYGGRIKPRRIGVAGLGGRQIGLGGAGGMGGGFGGMGGGHGRMGGGPSQVIGGGLPQGMGGGLPQGMGGGGGSQELGGGGGPFGTFPGLGSALGGPSPTVAPTNGGDGEDLGLLGLIQQSLKNAQAIRQGGPQGKEAAAAAAGQILQQFTGFDLNNIGGNFGNLFGR